MVLLVLVLLARLYHFFFYTQYFTGEKVRESGTLPTIEQFVQATTAFAGRLWPPQQPQSKLTTISSREFHCVCRLSVYFAVVKVATNGQQKLWWPARIALQ